MNATPNAKQIIILMGIHWNAKIVLKVVKFVMEPSFQIANNVS